MREIHTERNWKLEAATASSSAPPLTVVVNWNAGLETVQSLGVRLDPVWSATLPGFTLVVVRPVWEG
jgi:hypothetical protein